MKNIMLLTCMCSMILIACNNDKEIADYDVVFTIIDPDEGVAYTSGDEFHMEVDFDATKPIMNLEVLVINMTSGDTLYNYQTTTNQDFYMFHEHPILSVGEASVCRFEVSAWETSYANRIWSDVHFNMNP